MLESQVQHTEEINATLQQLDEPVMSALPEAALRQVQASSAEFVPYLIDLIRRETEVVRREKKPSGRNGHFFALYLLAEFKALEAWPTIREAILLPDDSPFDLFNDAITEDLPAMLPVFTAEHPEWLDELIANREANLHVRWAAADAFMHLVRSGRLTREDVIGRLHRHLKQAIQDREEEVCTPLVLILMDFGATVALDDIREAYRLDLADEGMITFEEVEESLENPDENFQSRLENCRPSGIADTVESLRSWHFNARDAAGGEWNDENDDFDESRSNWAGAQEFDPPVVAGPIRHEGPHVGRNDSCPCGSGKKFKKCCLRQAK